MNDPLFNNYLRTVSARIHDCYWRTDSTHLGQACHGTLLDACLDSIQAHQSVRHARGFLLCFHSCLVNDL